MKKILLLTIGVFTSLAMSPQYLEHLNELQTRRCNEIYCDKWIKPRNMICGKQILPPEISKLILGFIMPDKPGEQFFEEFIEKELKTPTYYNMTRYGFVKPLENYSGFTYIKDFESTSPHVVASDGNRDFRMEIYPSKQIIPPECYNEKFAQILCVALDAFTKAMNNTNEDRLDKKQIRGKRTDFEIILGGSSEKSSIKITDTYDDTIIVSITFKSYHNGNPIANSFENQFWNAWIRIDSILYAKRSPAYLDILRQWLPCLNS